MTQKEKTKFRQSKEWKDFRKKIAEKFEGKDAISGKKLYKGFILHHLDLNPENYDVLDENNFIPLNKATHECIHFLVRYDLSILEELAYYLKKMKDFRALIKV